jgi:hypothetical protein
MDHTKATALRELSSVFYFISSYSFFGYGYFRFEKQKNNMNPLELSSQSA